MLIYLPVWEQRRQEKTTDCAALTNNTLGDCNATNSAAEIITRSEKEKEKEKGKGKGKWKEKGHENIYICSQDTCGSGQCPNLQERSLDNSALGFLFKRGQPERGEWTDPSDFDGNVEDFIRNEIIKASDSPLRAIVQPSIGSDITTSKHITFENNYRSLSVKGLWGCTSIIVVSERGAWASHIWETDLKPNGHFQEMAIQRVHEGLGTDEHKFGIDELRNHGDAGARGVIFGDKNDPEDKPHVEVIIVTPRPHADIARLTAAGFFETTPDTYRENPHINLDKPPVYANRVEDIKTDMKQTFGQNVPINVFTYAPRVETVEQTLDLIDYEDAGQMELFERKMSQVRQRLGDPGIETARGKVVLQYRPDNGCQRAGWRIFLEGDGVKAEHNWNALPGQKFIWDKGG